MNNIIGALIVSMAIGGTAPINTNIDKNDYMPSIEANGTLVFGPTEAEKQEEAERLRRAEEARKAAEEAKRAEEERQRKEYEKNHPELLNYDHDIASYTTYYSQSSGVANRNHNMKLACDAINGVISGGKMVNAIGGGICQVSTTLFDAALYSGMTITERRNHSLKVGYVPAGMDATCSWGSIDFKFRNDLEIPVKIDTYMENGTMKIRFLSPSDPNLGKIELKVTQNGGVYTLKRYVDGVVDYTTNSRYR